MTWPRSGVVLDAPYFLFISTVLFTIMSHLNVKIFLHVLCISIYRCNYFSLTYFQHYPVFDFQSNDLMHTPLSLTFKPRLTPGWHNFIVFKFQCMKKNPHLYLCMKFKAQKLPRYTPFLFVNQRTESKWKMLISGSLVSRFSCCWEYMHKDFILGHYGVPILVPSLKFKLETFIVKLWLIR